MRIQHSWLQQRRSSVRQRRSGRKTYAEVAVRIRRLLVPGAHIHIGFEHANLLQREPSTHGVLCCCQAHVGHGVRLHYADPIRALAEALRLWQQSVIDTRHQAGLLLRFAHRRTQGAAPIVCFGVALGEGPDARVAPAQQKEAGLAIKAGQYNARASVRHFVSRRIRCLVCRTQGCPGHPPCSTFSTHPTRPPCPPKPQATVEECPSAQRVICCVWPVSILMKRHSL